MRHGLSLISGVIFIAIMLSITALVYTMAMPAVVKIRDAAVVENMKSAFADIDEVIREVAAEGRGSKRTITLNVQEGQLVVNSSQNALFWSMETQADIISPRSEQQFGNIHIGNQLETSARAGTYMGTPAYILENEYLTVYINKTGTPTGHTGIRTSQLVLAIQNHALNQTINNSGFFDIAINDNDNTRRGTGYTVANRLGYNLPAATVTAFISSSVLDYFVNLTLMSGTDFLEIKGYR